MSTRLVAHNRDGANTRVIRDAVAAVDNAPNGPAALGDVAVAARLNGANIDGVVVAIENITAAATTYAAELWGYDVLLGRWCFIVELANTVLEDRRSYAVDLVSQDRFLHLFVRVSALGGGANDLNIAYRGFRTDHAA